MSKAFKALGDETRREILKMLNERDMTAGEISDKFDMARPSISKHLDVLREAELVSSEKKGQYVIYSINTSVLQRVLGGFLDIFSK
ncbi:autorepressor SdpR family transcription factor [Paraclostridium sordellii]|uniref:ArsR family transcriptional regulator n=1 Tax=Paraclostridium sordellii TaxID=1505 RepID=A0A0C7SIG6_PARSO|nr:autorepressor SdpR family transcription factor [Paeniclostridium sordellii]AUN14247.1 transcriptional regulator [Paeniclostridium sordellii]MBS6022711.1 winged helix-turn-helix transcriptional regulator [Paeniclostridium sordellii]MDU2686912.1 autorepressor SdpR family transcription factor [Paeniclostridium sordellii]MDU6248745.1 autorepressor SdpR family transcription factor [Paeniclostridium sordellii]MDU7967763.1 autorepressor SdpR family transcription factor [Paeniclostridium sordellii]